MAEESKVSFNRVDKLGNVAMTQIDVRVEDYMEAADKKISLSQLYAQKYPVKQEIVGGKVTYPEGTALEQFMMSAGIRVRADEARGIPATTMKEIMHGSVDLSAGTIVRPQTTSSNNIAGRVLFNEIIMQLINEQLISNKDDYLNPWEAAIAVKTSVVGPYVHQPMINITAPEGSASQPIGQLAEPAVMVTITTNSKTYTIPTKSIGLQIADEATQNIGIDQVSIILASQARGERIRRIEADISNIINGDTDFGITATTFVNASTFDSTIPGTNFITHKAWVKWLRSKYDTMSMTHVLASDDAALAIEARTGRPTAQTDLSNVANRFPGDYTVANTNMPSPTMIIMPVTLIGANRVVGFDRSLALHQITNVSASYSAVEQFVMRRAQAMRFDYGTALFKFMDQAFTGLTLGA